MQRLHKNRQLFFSDPRFHADDRERGCVTTRFSEKLSPYSGGSLTDDDSSDKFSASGNKVVNRIKASFEFENGKIIKHTDSFDFPAWAKQALGFKGRLLGRTNFLKNKVRATAKHNLEKFISGNKEE